MSKEYEEMSKVEKWEQNIDFWERKNGDCCVNI